MCVSGEKPHNRRKASKASKGYSNPTNGRTSGTAAKGLVTSMEVIYANILRSIISTYTWAGDDRRLELSIMFTYKHNRKSNLPL